MDVWRLVLRGTLCYFTSELRATKRSPSDNLTRWIIDQSKGFTRKGIEKVISFVRAYVYLIRIS